MTRYYSTQRPVCPGSYPAPRANLPEWDGISVVKIVNFDSREFVPEIARRAWGYIEYSSEIPESEADDYELYPVKNPKVL